MERGAGFNRFHKHAKSSSGMSNILQPGGSSNNNANNNGNSNAVAQPCTVREQDQYMPIANVIRIMRRILPPHAKISDDAKETIQECVSEYISFITGEANERCQREQRKTITAEDVLWAMGKLGFDDYIDPLNHFLGRYRESENDKNNSVRGDPILKRSSSIDYHHHHHLLLQQQPLPMNMMMPPPPFHPQGGMFDPAAAAAAMGGGFYRDAQGASGSSSAQPSLPNNFDPFGQFK